MSALSLRASLGVVGLVLVTLGASTARAGRRPQRQHGHRRDFPGRRSVPAEAERAIARDVDAQPCHLLAGANDYRAVNLPGLPDDLEIGDAWLGWYESTDCGATWYSTLVPGYPQDHVARRHGVPRQGAQRRRRSGCAVRSGRNVLLPVHRVQPRQQRRQARARARHRPQRSRGRSSIPTRRYASDRRRSEPINPRRALSPIQYVGTTEMARGSGGRFIDKPSLAVFPAPTGTCMMDGETVPATNVYTAWTEFVGNSPENLRTKVYFARSLDCGKTFQVPRPS